MNPLADWQPIDHIIFELDRMRNWFWWCDPDKDEEIIEALALSIFMFESLIEELNIC